WGEEHPDPQLRAHPVPEADPRRALRRWQPVRRHPPDARALPLRPPQAGRTGHQPVPAGRGQPGLPGPDGRQEPARRDDHRPLTTAHRITVTDGILWTLVFTGLAAPPGPLSAQARLASSPARWRVPATAGASIVGHTL